MFFWSINLDAEKQGVFAFERKRKVEKAVKGKVFAIVVLAFTLMSACGGTVPSINTNAVAPTRQVTDDLGRTVTIPVDLRRVVSLAPNLTENIFAVGAGNRLIGVTTFCNYPDEAKRIAKIGDTTSPNLETIVGLKPDLVFVSTASQIEAFTKTLANNNISVYVMNPNSMDGVFRNLKQLGELFGTQQTAIPLVQNLVSRSGKVNTGGETPKVFVQISKEPLFTIGEESFLTEIVRRAGGQSVTANVATAYPKLSKETALAMNPDVIILSASDDNREPNEVFKNSPAAKNGHVVSINADLLSRPGPRLVDALEQITEALRKFRNN